ncbi:general alpha-glucoside permease [Trichoderma arundinaceum]|uniref:General alpha-glucoside permease n=1 Tax=Trichoderma arundinaceum TaxID=490622 RepID=A0A395NZC0_TRIAR|nr:general alpha-glucoside permease [Trichoderma arundinaceum]
MTASSPHDTDQGEPPISRPQQSTPSASTLSTPDASTPRNRSVDEPQEHEPVNNEHSPLLPPTDYDTFGPGSGGQNNGHIDDSQTTKSLWYLTLLTIGIGGLQIAWSVELSNGSPYLLSLGLSKSLMALVWIAGPLTGTLVQPYVGMLSDNCRLSWGKRKPFMLGGAAATIVGLLFLAWTKEIVSGVLGIFGVDPGSHGVKVSIIVTAVIGVYLLDFAINTVQAALRAFIVDCGPAHQQEAANSMASRMTGIGNIIGYIAGYVNLTTPLWFLGNTQFKILCAIASISLGSTVILSASLIKERDPRLDGPPGKKHSIFLFFFTLFKSIKRLPPQIKRVCQVQFFGWVGFFPLLFYTSSYIGELYVQPFLEENPHMSPEEIDKLYEQATRIGSFALLINSIVSLVTNVFLPFFVAPTYDSHPVSDSEPGAKKSFLDRLRIPGLTLRRVWFGSLILFAIVMVCTVFVRSINAAIVLIGAAGITWAITLWAPFAIISAEISRRDALARARRPRNENVGAPSTLPSTNPAGGHTSPMELAEAPKEEVDQAGVIMGIHNMSVSSPQIIANVGSSLIFKIWQKPRGTPGDHSIAIVMALGGLFALVSAFFVLRIKDDVSVPPETLADEEHGDADQDDYQQSPGGDFSGSTKPGYSAVPTTESETPRLVRNPSFGGLEVASGSDR